MTDWKSEVNAYLEQAAESEDARRLDLPEVIGDYRAVEGSPGWYMRKMKLRQQIQAMKLFDQRGQLEGAEVMESAVTIGSLLLYCVDLPDTEEAIREKLSAWARGEMELFRPATPDEIVDAFTMEELQDRVLTPMGFGAATEEPEGND